MSKPTRSALKPDLFAAEHHRHKIDQLGDPLQVIERHIDFKALTARIDEAFPRVVNPLGGRPAYPTEVMIRILILKRLYNLSDEQMEYQLLDRMSYQRFCQLTTSSSIPDRNTIWQYEQRIGEQGATILFGGIEQQLLLAGYIARCGQIIDATLVPAPKQRLSKQDKVHLERNEIPPDWTPKKRAQKDLDATWTQKHGRSTFGYKLSINVDNRYKLIRQYKTDTASVHDSRHFDAVLDPINTRKAIYADRGYASKAREAQLKQKGYDPHIQRKGVKNKPLSDCQQGRNWRIAKTRARVEHVFGSMRHRGGKLIRTIGQTRANYAMLMMCVVYNMKRFAMFKETGFKAF